MQRVSLMCFVCENILSQLAGRKELELANAESTPQLRLAAIHYSKCEDVDPILSDIAHQLKRMGYRVGGAVRSNAAQQGGHRCDITLEELMSGQTIALSQQLGSGSSGCRLNPEALEYVAGLVESSFDSGLDILVINKFGKREAEGSGFRDAIIHAVSTAVPVLVAVNEGQVAAWRNFCGGESDTLTADRTSILQWLTKSLPAAGASQFF